MKITDIDFTNSIAIAQLTTVLIIIAFLLLFRFSRKPVQKKRS